MNADLFRYAVLYHYGGVYVDVDAGALFHRQVPGEHVEFVVAETTPNRLMRRRSYARVRHTVGLLSTKGHPVLRLTLNKIVEKYHSEPSEGFDMTDRGTLERTGPGIGRMPFQNM